MFHHRQRARAALVALCAVLVVSLGLTGVAGAEPADYSVTGGWFYSQAGGGGGNGYSVLDAGTDTSGHTIKFWTEFKRLGGIETLGYPVGQPYTGTDGFVYQPFQRGVLQWRPELSRSLLANTFEQLQNAAKDSWLTLAKGVPAPVSDDGSAGDYAKARATRLEWLTNSAIKAKFLGNPNPAAISGWSIERSIEMYGLPMSQPEQHGPFISQRFQRIAFQLWTEDVAGMPAKGTVVGVLGGDLMKEAGLLPAAATIPLGPGGSAPIATPVPTAAPTPVAPTFPWHSNGIQAWPNCGTTYMRVYVRDGAGNGINGMAIKSWNDWGNEIIGGTRNWNGKDGNYERVFSSGAKAGRWYVALVDGNGTISSDTVTITFSDDCTPNTGGAQEIEVEFRQGGYTAPAPVSSQPTATPVPQSSGSHYWRISNQQGWVNCGTTYVRVYVRDGNGNGLNGMAIKTWNDWGNEAVGGTRNWNGQDGNYERVFGSGPKAGRWYVALVDGNGTISSDTATIDFSDSCSAGGVQEIEVEIKPR